MVNTHKTVKCVRVRVCVSYFYVFVRAWQKRRVRFVRSATASVGGDSATVVFYGTETDLSYAKVERHLHGRAASRQTAPIMLMLKRGWGVRGAWGVRNDDASSPSVVSAVAADVAVAAKRKSCLLQIHVHTHTHSHI